MNLININHLWGSLIIEELIRQGADYFCVAPGSRSSALTAAVAQNKKAKPFIHFDERGLAFHAMGYSAATHKPSVLICTSGSAVANFLPAIIEASKKKLPLIVLTADRPPELRQTGAVQTIDQVGIFGSYVKWSTDMPCPDLNIKPEYVLTTIDQAVYQAVALKGVVHINCMYREPLAPVKSKDDLSAYTKSLSSWDKSNQPYTEYIKGFESVALPIPKKIAQRLDAIKNGLIVVGKIGGADEQTQVLNLAEKLGWPIFADISSGLRLGQEHKNVIHYFDHLLLSDALKDKLKFDGVLHLGGRITSKRYYEFVANQDLNEYIMVLNHSLRNDPNHQVSLRIESTVSNFIQTIIGLIKPRKASAALKNLSTANQKADKQIESFFKGDERLCEPRTARLVSQLIPKGQGLFLSNSMPLRDMDFYADYKGAKVSVNGNRGASGIDGIIASACGYAQGLQMPTTLMIGDLAALYDLNSLSMLRDTKQPLIIMVLNNGGGGIFSFLPIAEFKEGFEKFWGTPHSYTLSNAAAMFELNYAQPMSVTDFKKAYKQALQSQTSTIIEVMTSREENLKVHRQLQHAII